MLRDTVLFVTMLALVGCAGNEQDFDPRALRERPIAPPTVEEARNVAIVLTLDDPTVMVDQVPSVKAALVNEGEEPIMIVLPGDGSSVGLRTPIVRWSHARSSTGCGFMSGPTLDQIVTVQPQGRVPLRWLHPPRFDEPGTYTVTLEVENKPDMNWQSVGEHDPQAMQKVRQSHRFRALSNPVELTVVPSDDADG